MGKWRAGIIIFFLYIVGLTGGPSYTYAEEDTSGASAVDSSAVGFSYKVIKPDNQQDLTVGYFDLRMEPGQKQTVQIELINSSPEEKEILISLNGAKTNGNGVIEYGPTAIDNDKSLKYDFAELVTGPEAVTIPAQGNVTVDLEIAMPEVSFDGMISGGIQLKEAADDEEREKQTGVINEYAFIVGMVLTETDTVVSPELELNKVSAGLSNFRNSIYVNFSNVEAAYLNDLTMDVQITKKDSDKVLYDSKKANMRVAPNSMVDFPVSMSGEKMVPGNYRALVSATAGDRHWEWDQDFTITDEEADKFNQEDVNLNQEQGINWLLVGIILGCGILASVLIFVIVRIVRRKGRKKTTRKRKSKKK